MPFENVLLSQLLVNPANDRHGELRDESAAIDELFRMHDPRMRALTRDIVDAGRVFDPPLVMVHDQNYVVFDGNRRVTCMKLLRDRRDPQQTRFESSSELSALGGRVGFLADYNAKLRTAAT